jgi:ribosome assembly protein 1
MAPPKTADQPRGTVIGRLAGGLVTFKIRAVPLPEAITSYLIANGSTLKSLQRSRGEEDSSIAASADVGEMVKPEAFWETLDGIAKKAGKEWSGLVEQAWSFGPRRVGPNVLVDRTPGATRSCVSLTFFSFLSRSVC